MKTINKQQQLALQHPCCLGVETMHPRFASVGSTHSIVLTVNNGYE